jgi:hypothetical protein
MNLFCIVTRHKYISASVLAKVVHCLAQPPLCRRLPIAISKAQVQPDEVFRKLGDGLPSVLFDECIQSEALVSTLTLKAKFSRASAADHRIPAKPEFPSSDDHKRLHSTSKLTPQFRHERLLTHKTPGNQ